MNTCVLAQGIVLTLALRDRVKRGVALALSRYRPHIDRATVILEENSGSGRELEKGCRVLLVGKRGWRVGVRERGVDIEPVIVNALSRARRNVACILYCLPYVAGEARGFGVETGNLERLNSWKVRW